jgi:hypothetical protein
MMQPDDYKVVAESLYRALYKPPKFDTPPVPSGEPSTLAGIWLVKMEYLRGSANHRLMFEQAGNKLSGLHEGETISGALRGEVQATQVHFRSSHPYQGTSITYEFHGAVQGDTMSGEVGLGEYGSAKWHATRYSKT